MTAGARVVRISVSAGGVPNIQGSFRGRDYSRVSQKRHPGDGRVYARVLREGSLASGEPVQLLTEEMALPLIGRR